MSESPWSCVPQIHDTMVFVTSGAAAGLSIT